MGGHWLVGYVEVVEHYDHALHMRVVDNGESQRSVGVGPKITASLDELVEKHP